MELKLTLNERIILANQFEILSRLDENDSKSYENLRQIVQSGYEGLYIHLYSHFETSPIPREITTETFKILDMYRMIDASIKESKNPEINLIKFNGFDANHAPHYAIMSFMVEDFGRYSEHKGTYYNSHGSSSLTTYRKLLNAYHELNTRIGFEKLTEEQIQVLIDAVKS